VLGDALFAYFHFIAVFLAGALLLLEAAICRAEFARVLFKVDLGYFAAAILAIATGLARLNFDAKGAQFYLDNPVFWMKMGIFLAVGLMSIAPTVKFIRWAKSAKADPRYEVPERELASVRKSITLELVLFAAIPLFAVLMARGFGV
jgi:putative membrane protein